MRKILSVFLITLLVLMQFVCFVSAEEQQEKNEIVNVSPLGVAYCTSEKNSLWTPAKSLKDGLYGTEDWHGWECAYPEVEVGQDTSAGFSGEFCGIKFDESYYEIYNIRMNIGLHTLSGGQNATYTIQALVAGKWQEIAVLKDEQAIPCNKDKYSSFADVMADKNASHRVCADLYVTLDEPVTTNNVRVVVSDYAKNYEGGDVLIFPFIYELELFGKEGKAPDLILPEGASETVNVAWHSYPSAPLGTNGTYPFLAIDADNSTYWEIENYQGNEYFTLMLDKEYEIGGVELLFQRSADKKFQNTVLEFLVDGEWKTPENYNASFGAAEEGYYSIVYSFAATPTTAVRIKLRTPTQTLRLCEVQVNLKDTKTYCFENRFTEAQMLTASNGNLAIIGKPYSSSSFDPYSSESFINDGLSKGSKVWFTGELKVPEYCGLTFDYPQKISGAIVSFRESSVIGRENMKFEIQALVNGEYVTLAQGRSYNERGTYKYRSTYAFDEVETTDVRVVILEAHGAIPNLMELELYSKDLAQLPMFEGIERMSVNDKPQPEQNENQNTNTNTNQAQNGGAQIEEEEPVKPWIYLIPIISAVVIAACAVTVAIIKKKKQ